MSRWWELDPRPFPSPIPLFYVLKRARLYLFARGEPLSVVRALNAPRSWPLKWLLTVIRDSLLNCFNNGQALRATMEMLYH